jgi:hypothetical protein
MSLSSRRFLAKGWSDLHVFGIVDGVINNEHVGICKAQSVRRHYFSCNDGRTAALT